VEYEGYSRSHEVVVVIEAPRRRQHHRHHMAPMARGTEVDEEGETTIPSPRAAGGGVAIEIETGTGTTGTEETRGQRQDMVAATTMRKALAAADHRKMTGTVVELLQMSTADIALTINPAAVAVTEITFVLAVMTTMTGMLVGLPAEMTTTTAPSVVIILTAMIGIAAIVTDTAAAATTTTDADAVADMTTTEVTKAAAVVGAKVGAVPTGKRKPVPYL